MKFCKRAAVLLLALVLVAGLVVPASAVKANECGLRVVKNDSYNKDGKYYLGFQITGGCPPGAYSGSAVNTSSAKLVNAAGKTVFSWGEYEFAAGKTITRNYGADYSKLAAGTYTLQLTVRTKGWTDYSYQYGGYGTQYNYGFTWSYTINHKKSASLSLESTESVYMDGGYENKFVFRHSGVKGKSIHIEIYEAELGAMCYKADSSKPVSYDSGTYYFTWDGYPKGGGIRRSSGEYIVKYWYDGGKAKQTTVWLNIY
jgi:hypothetical protein